MSYVTVAEIGTVSRGKATIATGGIEAVRNSAEAINRRLGFDGLYVAETTWDVLPGRAVFRFRGDGLFYLYMGYPVIHLASVNVYAGTALIAEYDSVDTDIYSEFWMPTDEAQFAPTISLRVKGTRGHCIFKDLEASDEILAGQTILRGDDETRMLFEEDGVAEAGDVLLVPPPGLNHVAVTVARRQLALERDQGGRIRGVFNERDEFANLEKTVDDYR